MISTDGKQLGILALGDALTMARANGVDLVEIAPNATPPVCRLVDFGKFRYEQAKRDKESRKHQHATKVKEVQLSPKIDPHDLGVKVGHAVDFLCEDMKIKVTLKFRGREMAHTEFGFQVIQKFLEEIAPYGHPDFEPKLVGRGINLMISPLPRNKRAKHPLQGNGDGRPAAPSKAQPEFGEAPAPDPDRPRRRQTRQSKLRRVQQQPLRASRNFGLKSGPVHPGRSPRSTASARVSRPWRDAGAPPRSPYCRFCVSTDCANSFDQASFAQSKLWPIRKNSFRRFRSKFQIYGEILHAETLKIGHINETYTATYDQGGTRVRYIHQKINQRRVQESRRGDEERHAGHHPHSEQARSGRAAGTSPGGR